MSKERDREAARTKYQEQSEIAKRARAEAQARRTRFSLNDAEIPKERNGPKGPEPTRYGDWEREGIARDF